MERTLNPPQEKTDSASAFYYIAMRNLSQPIKYKENHILVPVLTTKRMLGLKMLELFITLF